MDQISLSARPRDEKGSKAVRKLRAAGLVPAVVYGREFGEPLAVALDGRELRSALHGHSLNTVINLNIQGRGVTPVMVYDHQVDVVTKHVLHVDLHAVNLNEEVEADVPVVITGSAPGVRDDGGVLDVVLHDITVEALPGSIPEKFSVDVGELHINQSIHVRDIAVPAGVKIMNGPDELVVSVLPPSKIEEPVAAEAAVVEAPAEPELIGEKKPAEEPEE